MSKVFFLTGITAIILILILGTGSNMKTMAVPQAAAHELPKPNQNILRIISQELPVNEEPKSVIPSLKLSNAARPINTLTYEGSGEAVHPSVIDFKLEYSLENWRGFRFWMAMTPYPGGYEAFENPCLLASNDGLTWVVPKGFNRPLDVKGGKGNFNSDPALVYDPDQQSLFVYWREYAKGVYERIWRLKINSAGAVGSKELCLEDNWSDREGLMLSPSIWRKSANEWYMWTANGNTLLHLYVSSDGKKWGAKRRCTTPWLTWNGGYKPWHLETKPNFREQRIEFFISGWPKNENPGNLVLLYAQAPMNDLTNLSMPFPEPVLKKGTPGSWDDSKIYKTSFTIEPTTATYKYHVWYSARSELGHWHIGYTEGSLSTEATVP